MLGSRKRLLAATAITAAFSAFGVAQAQDAPVSTAPVQTASPSPANSAEAVREAKIEALQAEIQDLAAQIQDLKASSSAAIKAVRADEAAKPAVSLAGGRPTITTPDGNFTFAVRTVAQLDAAHYDVDPRRTDNDLASGTVFRRARLGFDATAFKVWNFALWGDFGASAGESPALNQAYLEYAGFRPLGDRADPLRIRAGAWATPAGLEDATGNAEMVFIERAAVAEMVRGLDAGDGREGAGVFWSGPRWYVSGVLTGKVAGPTTTAIYNQQEGFVTRVAFNPLHGANYDVHLGGSIQGVIKPVDTTAGPVLTQSITLAQQPESRVDANGTKLVSTGAISANKLTTYGLEGGASFRNLYLAGEWFKIDVDRTAVGTSASPFNPSFDGWYIQGSWTLTGERHAWSSANGGFRGIRPAHPFSLRDGGLGAFEIAARYSVLDLNDNEGVAGSATPFGGIRGGKQDITTVGLNWYPNSVIRFLLDYQWVDVNRLNATGADIGEHDHTLSFRSQFAF